mmetsp:Transcript_2371/g.5279  ORF Transcript_2371/g.5279 Transcript_2371/m.5279 type:complete len:96 (-) Transcript_2371:545-832(-)
MFASRWFEFTVSFYLIFGISVKIGLYVGPLKVTLFEFNEGEEILLLPSLELYPELEKKDSIGALYGYIPYSVLFPPYCLGIMLQIVYFLHQWQPI